LLDLIVGWGDGSVVWYRNVGSRTEPKLAKGITLVQPAPWPSYDDNAPPTEDNNPGVRAKVCVVDWNGDGHLDLLVGDFGGGSALRDLLDVAIHRLPAKYRVPVLRWRLRRPRLPYRLR
jgi:hypothetical protein